VLALSPSASSGKSLANPYPYTVLQTPADLQEPQDDIPYCDDRLIVPPLITPPGGCNKLQVVMMIDQSFSMRSNDPEYFRFRGAKYFVDLLAYRYLEALAAHIPQPEVELAVLHFGTNVYVPKVTETSEVYKDDWITFPPDSNGTWTKLFEQLNYNVDPQDPKPGSLEATHFTEPFERAAALFHDSSPQMQGCPQRVILLLTDGGPADAQVYSGKKLRDYMLKMKETVDAFRMVGDGNYIYVTIFNTVKSYSWEAQPHWVNIVTEDGVPPLDGLPPVAEEFDIQGVTKRMKKIVSAHLGEISLPVEAWPVVFPPYL